MYTEWQRAARSCRKPHPVEELQLVTESYRELHRVADSCGVLKIAGKYNARVTEYPKRIKNDRKLQGDVRSCSRAEELQ